MVVAERRTPCPKTPLIGVYLCQCCDNSEIVSDKAPMGGMGMGADSGSRIRNNENWYWKESQRPQSPPTGPATPLITHIGGRSQFPSAKTWELLLRPDQAPGQGAGSQGVREPGSQGPGPRSVHHYVNALNAHVSQDEVPLIRPSCDQSLDLEALALALAQVACLPDSTKEKSHCQDLNLISGL